MGAKTVIDTIERYIESLQFDKDLADLSDAEYEAHLRSNGVLVEGSRWPEAEIDRWLEILNHMLEICRRRKGEGDAEFFDVVTWYAIARSMHNRESDARRRENLGRVGGKRSALARARKREDSLDRAAVALNTLISANAVKRYNRADIAAESGIDIKKVRKLTLGAIKKRAKCLSNS